MNDKAMTWNDMATDRAERVRVREETITGQTPRIPPLHPDDYTPEVRESTRQLKIAAGLPPEGEVPEYVATALRHPELYRAHTALAILLMSQGTLPVRDRELAVLRIGWLCGAPFEWGEHVAMGRRVAGLTGEEIERVIVGSSAPEWSEHDRAIIRAVEELHADAMISTETWDVLARSFDEKQLIEFPILIGQYQGVAYLQNSLRVRMMPGNPGLTAR